MTGLTRFHAVVILSSVDFTPAQSSRNGVSTGVPPAMPDALRLEQNYPNPFNPSTVIRFQAPDREDRLSIRIFGIDGKCVKTLLDGPADAGHHSLRWNGVNDRGESVASGIYYLRMDSGDYTEVRKMLLLK